MSKVRFFISYSHEDAVWFEKGYLMPQLIRDIERNNGEVWYDRGRLQGGSPYRDEIERAIKQAHVAILLVSLDFLISDFILDYELPWIKERVDTAPLFRVICLKVGHLSGESMPFEDRFLHLPAEQEPLIEIHENQGKWSRTRAEIHQCVRDTIRKIQQPSAQPATAEPPKPTPPPQPPAAPSAAKPAKRQAPPRPTPGEPKAPPIAAATPSSPARVEVGPERASLKPAEAVPASAGPPAGTADTVEIAPGVALDLVWCPPGTFLMGSPDSDDMAQDNEKPQHQVTLTKGFWMGKYPVTQEQWEAIMGDNPSHNKGARRPVECVSWNDSQGYLEKLSSLTSGSFRLPTEAEWECACRAGTTTRFWFGDDPAGLDDYAWYVNNGARSIHPVGEKRANAWGLHDTHGNVLEWCQDRHRPYASEQQQDPVGPGSGAFRVLRGGSCYYPPGGCRSAYRFSNAPVNRPYGHGFRVVRTDSDGDRTAVGTSDSKATSERGTHDGNAPGIECDTIELVSREERPDSPSVEAASAGPPAGTADTVEIAPGITLDLVWCPPGTFLMGSPDSDDMARDSEKPQHQVTLTKGFWMGKYPVTQAQWEAVMGDNPSKFEGPQNPVECVAGKGCQEFLARLKSFTGSAFRLPIVAEWEYACRAGTTARFCFGDAPAGLDDYGWYRRNSEGSTHPVGEKRPNAWGLHDMHGNVAEWCQVRHLPGPSKEHATPYQGHSSGHAYVLRGGRWNDAENICRSASHSGHPAKGGCGFRIVRS